MRDCPICKASMIVNEDRIRPAEIYSWMRRKPFMIPSVVGICCDFCLGANRAGMDLRLLRDASLKARTASMTRTAYSELIMAVETKYPGETRHDTALRYIREAENQNNPPMEDTDG